MEKHGSDARLKELVTENQDKTGSQILTMFNLEHQFMQANEDEINKLTAQFALEEPLSPHGQPVLYHEAAEDWWKRLKTRAEQVVQAKHLAEVSK